jgi:hypothetical protein
MNAEYQIPEPFLYNPLKHHLGFIKGFINQNIDSSGLEIHEIIKELRHIGTSVMDVYRGNLSIEAIIREISAILYQMRISDRLAYLKWTEANEDNYMKLSLSDGSQWALKNHDDPHRYVHFFPARNSDLTFRIKANTLKSAMIYILMIGKDLVTASDLNKVRRQLRLSPIKDSAEAQAIMEMIEILRG